MMRLVSELLPLSDLGICGVGRITSTRVHAPVPAVASVLSSVPTTMKSTIVTLGYAFILVVSIGNALSITPTFPPLDVPPCLP